MRKQTGNIYPTNRKNQWVVVTRGEKVANIISAKTQDAAAKKFFDSRNMRMIKSKK